MPGPTEENCAERQDQGIPDQRRAGSFERPPGTSEENPLVVSDRRHRLGCRLRAFSKGYQSASTRMGQAILQCAALDRDAPRWAFRSHGRAGVAGRGYPHVVPNISGGEFPSSFEIVVSRARLRRVSRTRKGARSRVRIWLSPVAAAVGQTPVRTLRELGSAHLCRRRGRFSHLAMTGAVPAQNMREPNGGTT